MKNKLLIISIIGIILISIILSVLFLNKNGSKDNIYTNENGEVLDELLTINKVIDERKENDVTVDNIRVFIDNNSLRIVTVLKNNTDKDINGFFIKMEFLDKKNNSLFPIGLNSDSIIPKNGTVSIENFVDNNDKNKQIVNAKILFLEKNIQQSIEESLNTLNNNQ